jgi:FG-GAP-like repeat
MKPLAPPAHPEPGPFGPVSKDGNWSLDAMGKTGQLARLLSAILFLTAGCSHPAGPAAGVDENRICSGPGSTKVPTFGPGIPVPGDGGTWSGENVSALAGDVNDDGRPDLVVLNTNVYDPASFSSIYLGLDDGGLGDPQPFGEAAYAAVLDPDGGAPFASIDGFQKAGIHRSDGFQSWSAPSFTFAYGLSVADFDRDGKPDLMLCDGEGKGVDVAFNMGGGKFHDPTSLSPAGCYAVAAGDLDLDGVSDLVLLGNSRFEADVLIGNPDGGFASTSYPIQSEGFGYSVVLKDLNGDGRPDILAVDSYGAEGLPDFFVLLNEGGGRFDNAVSYPIGAATGLPAWRQVVIADFNGDCWPDVVVSRAGASMTGDLYLFLNRGDGTFLMPSKIATGLPCPKGIARYRPAGALLPSIAVVDSCAGQVEILPNTTKP